MCLRRSQLGSDGVGVQTVFLVHALSHSSAVSHVSVHVCIKMCFWLPVGGFTRCRALVLGSVNSLLWAFLLGFIGVHTYMSNSGITLYIQFGSFCTWLYILEMHSCWSIDSLFLPPPRPTAAQYSFFPLFCQTSLSVDFGVPEAGHTQSYSWSSVHTSPHGQLGYESAWYSSPPTFHLLSPQCVSSFKALIFVLLGQYWSPDSWNSCHYWHIAGTGVPCWLNR